MECCCENGNHTSTHTHTRTHTQEHLPHHVRTPWLPCAEPGTAQLHLLLLLLRATAVEDMQRQQLQPRPQQPQQKGTPLLCCAQQSRGVRVHSWRSTLGAGVQS